jgi:tocopherol cyclase
MGFHYEGVDYDYNFSQFWKKSHIDFEFIEASPDNIWHITAVNKCSKIIITLSCPQSEMLWIRYESPDGMMRHNRLWNGGTGQGILQLFHLDGSKEILIDTIRIKNAGCEYGEYQ